MSKTVQYTKIVLGLISLLAFDSTSTLAAIAADQCSPKFIVRVKLDTVSGKNAMIKNCFFVDAAIKNNSANQEDVILWTQSGWSWFSSNPHFTPGIEALKNVPTKITLNPGQVVNQKVEVWADEHIKNNRFKMGFVAQALRPVSGISDPKELALHNIYWSNWITYKIPVAK